MSFAKFRTIGCMRSVGTGIPRMSSDQGKPGRYGDHRDSLPHKIPTGGKHSENGNNVNGTNGDNGIDGGELINDVQGWKETHASDSEAIVKAERHDDTSSVKVLQEKTESYFAERQSRKRKREDE